MLKIAMDASYLEALIEKKHEKHKLADKLAQGIRDSYRICIPIEEYSKVFDTFSDCIPDTKEKIRKVLVENATLFSPNKQNIIDALDIYGIYKNKISYFDCALIESFKEREIQYIISFDEKWDNVEEVKMANKVLTNGKIYFP